MVPKGYNPPAPPEVFSLFYFMRKGVGAISKKGGTIIRVSTITSKNGRHCTTMRRRAGEMNLNIFALEASYL